MELTMNSKPTTRLEAFNSLALHFQDEAFTLAYYLLGDESHAAEAAQAAFSGLYQRSGHNQLVGHNQLAGHNQRSGLNQLAGLHQERFRLEMLHAVWLNCRRQGVGVLFHPKLRPTTADDLSRRLFGLREDERLVVVLVDMLGLDYDQTGRVLGCSKKQVGKLLTQGRLHMSGQGTTVH